MPASASVLRVRVSIIDTEPEIWRLLELDVGLTLDRVHEVLQVAFGWQTTHLHVFTDQDPTRRLRSVKPEPRRWADQNEIDEEVAELLESEATLGEVLTKRAPLFYEYDFGDGWVHRLELIETIEQTDAPAATLIRASERGPLEDSGGPHGWAEIRAALSDPTHERHEELSAWATEPSSPWGATAGHPIALFDEVDVDGINRELTQLFEASATLPAALEAVVDRMHPALQRDIRSLAHSAAVGTNTGVDAPAAERMLRPYLWLLRRVGEEGIALTGAGYLPPAVVSAAMRELEWEWRWVGTFTRENQTLPVLHLRQRAQRLGLVRTLKGRLVLTAKGRRALTDPHRYWSVLAGFLLSGLRSKVETDAVTLFLLDVAGGLRSRQGEYDDAVAYGLNALGYAERDGGDVSASTAGRLLWETWDLFVDLGVFEPESRRYRDEVRVTEDGRAFARAALAG